MRSNRVTIRLNEEEKIVVEKLKQAISEKLGTEVTESQVLRSALSFFWNESIKKG